MDDMEDGELPDSPTRQDDSTLHGDAIDAPYTPLLRPECVKSINNIVTRPRSATNSSTVANMGDISDFDDVRTSEVPTPSGSSSPKASFQNVATLDSDDDDDTPANRILRGLPGSSSDEGSDSDNETGGRPARKVRKSSNASLAKGSSGGEAFRSMASQFQKDLATSLSTSNQFQVQSRLKKSKANNVWGAVLTEETLTSDLTGIGVGKRSLKDIQSDRGAETYDYMMVAELKASVAGDAKVERVIRDEEIRRSSLDKDLEQYWHQRDNSVKTDVDDVTKCDAMESCDERRMEAIRAGKKRSVKDRLGQRGADHPESGQEEVDDGHNQLDNMSIPQPGISRNIPDITPGVLEMLQEAMKNGSNPDPTFPSDEEKMENDDNDDGEVDDEDDLKSTILGEELAAKLSEPKAQLMIQVVDLVGTEVALELFSKTQTIEKDGGMMIMNGDRRRTPGGVFLHLLRGLKDPRVDVKKIKKFFNNNGGSNRPPPVGRHNNHYGNYSNNKHQRNYGNNMGHRHKHEERAMADNFQAELDAFQKLSKTKKTKKSRNRDPKKMEESEAVAEEDKELKPLPDILAFFTNQMTERNKMSPDVSQQDDESSTSAGGSSGLTASGYGSGAANTDDLGLPDVPPNSVEPVERTLSVYEDDFLSAETEEIELF